MKKIKLKILLYLICLPILISGQPFYKETNNTANDSIISELIGHISHDSVQSYIQSLQNFGTRFMMAPNRKEVASWISNKFVSIGIEAVRIDSSLCETVIDFWNLHYDTTTWQYNVIATIPGIENTDEYFVIGAHYDDVVSPDGDSMVYAPGADDNASGVAALFEIARIFLQYNYNPKTTIEFVAFGAEELMGYGNSGAEGYVNQALNNGMDIKLMVNNDMIANSNSNDWEIKIFNFVGSEWLTEIAVDVTNTYTEIEPFLPEPSSTGHADTKYFFSAGIPCLYFMERDFNSFYHSEDDLVSNCEMDYCAEVIKISMGVLVKADNMVTGVNELVEIFPIKVFPNPCCKEFVAAIPESLFTANLNLRLMNIYGHTVIEKYQVNSNHVLFDVSHLAPGIYFLSSYTPKTNKSVLISVN